MFRERGPTGRELLPGTTEIRDARSVVKTSHFQRSGSTWIRSPARLSTGLAPDRRTATLLAAVWQLGLDATDDARTFLFHCYRDAHSKTALPAAPVPRRNHTRHSVRALF